MTVLVGRQPIFDRNLDVFGYELLFCPRERGMTDGFDGDIATATVALDTFVEIGTENLVGSHYAFFNMTRNFLVSEYYQVLPADRVVLEILEDIEPDAEVLAAIRAAKRRGYQIALDDFIARPELEPLIELADIIKVETLGMSSAELKRHADLPRPRQSLLLAEKVETHEEFEACRDLGYDLFRGYFFCRPQVVRKAKRSTNRIALLRLMARLHDPAVSFDEIESIVSSDVSFCYAVLRAVNSALYALPRHIESVHQALVMLGVAQIRNLAAVMMMASVSEGKPNSLLNTALERAKFCELMSASADTGVQTKYFTVGLFSVLDAITDQPMEELLSTLPLTDEVRDAILRFEGRAGATLRAAVACERAEFDDVLDGEFDPDQVQKAYLAALDWAYQTRRRLMEGIGAGASQPT